jgi:N-acyl-D-aspartate/D-glutamate deacylase
MHDLVIRNGLIIDGSGNPGRQADLAIDGSVIVEVGNKVDRGRREFDAGGKVVSPGFIDAHTHLDAQIFWDPVSASLSSHGVTTAVMGNCGFTLAPSAESAMDLVLRSIERSEDMSRDAIIAGVPWQWVTYAEYLHAVDALPKGINCAGYVGHSAVRAHVMGERAFEMEATEADVAAMAIQVEEALRAGAMGFSTSRSFHHLTFSDGPVASRLAAWSEVASLVEVLGRLGAGIFQLAPERSEDPDARASFQRRLVALIRATGRPATFMLGGDLDILEAISDGVAGSSGRAVGQMHVRGFENVYSFETTLPFDSLPSWRPIRNLSTEEQLARFADPAIRARLVEEAMKAEYAHSVGAEPRPPVFDEIYLVGNDEEAALSVAELARLEGVTPIEVMIDRSVTSKFKQCFRQPLRRFDSDGALAALRRSDTVIAASDSGAHVSQILDSNIPAYLLSYWVRERKEFTLAEAVKMLTRDPALSWGFSDRGLLRPGFAADVVVFDPQEVGSALPHVSFDLPDGGPRLVQQGQGFDLIAVNGVVTWLEGNHTGDFSGRLLRGSLAAQAAAAN